MHFLGKENGLALEEICLLIIYQNYNTTKYIGNFVILLLKTL